MASRPSPVVDRLGDSDSLLHCTSSLIRLDLILQHNPFIVQFTRIPLQVTIVS
jgi:hypothetical protein